MDSKMDNTNTNNAQMDGATDNTKKTNVVLIGMPASGKSTFGVVLAKVLNMHFVDTDLVIQSETKKTLQQLIDELGATGFLQIENNVLSSHTYTNTVVSTGGSAVYSQKAMEHLRQSGLVVFLKVPLDELILHIGNLDERGVVFKSGLGHDLQKLYAEREPLYKKYADITVDVAGLNTREAVAQIVAAIKAFLAK